MKEFLIATGNAGKMREFEHLFSGFDVKLYSLRDFPEFEPPEEDGATFSDNAYKKAYSAALATGLTVIADDSGLCVDALDGRPGVFSARFAGVGAGDEANNQKLVEDLSGFVLKSRTAEFRCVIALCSPDGASSFFQGGLKGIILENPSGSGGFGYDPLFMVPEYGKTLAELSLVIKNRISHRGRACGALQEFLIKNEIIKSNA
ncbi:MAG: XTP/dITP diphosphatase [Geobacteraceae bacterium]|nr:XTP/dITP diphosphatase [Geobacteraceae bacterium]